jgi:hypothetical protein
MKAEGTVSLRWDTHSNHLGGTSEPPFVVPAPGRYRLKIVLTMGLKRDWILDVFSKWFDVATLQAREAANTRPAPKPMRKGATQ